MQPNKTVKPTSTKLASNVSTSRHAVPALHGVHAWSELLTEEDLRCERTGFQAGIISIDHGATGRAEETSAPIDTTTDDRTAAILAVVNDNLQFTNRVGVLNENEICVLMIPVANVGATEVLARKIDTALRSAGINAAIGFALRRSDGAGLHGAAARADACAAVAHSRQLRLTA